MQHHVAISGWMACYLGGVGYRAPCANNDDNDHKNNNALNADQIMFHTPPKKAQCCHPSFHILTLAQI